MILIEKIYKITRNCLWGCMLILGSGIVLALPIIFGDTTFYQNNEIMLVVIAGLLSIGVLSLIPVSLFWLGVIILQEIQDRKINQIKENK